jgi:hypothetical protein
MNILMVQRSTFMVSSEHVFSWSKETDTLRRFNLSHILQILKFAFNGERVDDD